MTGQWLEQSVQKTTDGRRQNDRDKGEAGERPKSGLVAERRLNRDGQTGPMLDNDEVAVRHI